MPRITLASYSVRLRSNKTRQPLDLAAPAAAGIFGFFQRHFEARAQTRSTHVQTRRVLGAEALTITPDHICGVIVTGEYGFESDLVDTTGKKSPYRRSAGEAELLPFYFHLYLPAAGDCGVLILQRFGVFGIRTILLDDLAEQFEQAFPDLSLAIWPQIPDGVLAALLGDGELKSVTLRKTTLPADICDALGESPQAAFGSIDFTISARRGHSFTTLLERARNFVNGQTGVALNDVVEVPGFKHDRTLLELQIGERSQTIDLTNLKKLRAHVDVTKKIALGANGHPALPSIAAEVATLLAAIRKTLNV